MADNGNAFISETMAVVGILDPESGLNNTTVYSDTVDMADFEQVMFILMKGEGTGSIVMTISECTASGLEAGGAAAGASALSGAVSVALGATDDDKQTIICVKRSLMADGFRYLQAKVVEDNTGTDDFAVIAIAGKGIDFTPASTYDATSVSAIIQVD